MSLNEVQYRIAIIVQCRFTILCRARSSTY